MQDLQFSAMLLKEMHMPEAQFPAIVFQAMQLREIPLPAILSQAMHGPEILSIIRDSIGDYVRVGNTITYGSIAGDVMAGSAVI